MMQFYMNVFRLSMYICDFIIGVSTGLVLSATFVRTRYSSYIFTCSAVCVKSD